jgi:hypothetical protein
MRDLKQRITDANLLRDIGAQAGKAVIVEENAAFNLSAQVLDRSWIR